MTEKTWGEPLKDSSVAIGIDQSLSGFAMTVINPHIPEQFWTGVYKSKKKGIARLHDIVWWMENKFDELDANRSRVTRLAMEAAIFASPSTLPLAELSGVIRMSIWQYFDGNMNTVIPFEDDIRYPLLVPPTTLKKYATGKGNAKKQEMMLQMYKRWGVELTDDNAADSYALARIAAGLHIDATEKAVIEQLKDPKYKDK